MASSRNEEEETRQINEEYKVWKKNTPFLYDTVVTHALECPSLTVHWLSNKNTSDSGKAVHQLFLGTHTPDQAQNFLLRADITLPNGDASTFDPSKFEETPVAALGGTAVPRPKFEIKQKINHDGEVNRIRVMPQNDTVVATKTGTGIVNVFEWTRHPLRPRDAEIRPQMRLRGHTKDGFGLSWHPRREALISSGGSDGLVCIWDLQGNPAINKLREKERAPPAVEMDPQRTIKAHSGPVGDVAWTNHQNVLISVGDDRKLNVWDTRIGEDRPVSSVADAHASEIHTVSCSGLTETWLATGGSDKAVKVWDLRKLSTSIHVLAAHTNDVYNVQWNPRVPGVLASGGADRRVMVWDLSRIGTALSPQELEDGPAELLFMHAGHTSKISDLAWSPNDDWLVASVSEDNILQVWQMAETIYAEPSDGDQPMMQ